MAEVSSFIQFRHHDKDVVEQLQHVFSGHYTGTNEELEALFRSINPEIVDLMRQTNNGHRNLEWLDPYPELRESASYLLDFDELDDDYRLWLGDTRHYDEALTESQFEDHGDHYEIHVGWNGFIGAFMVRLLTLAGARDVAFRQHSVDLEG